MKSERTRLPDCQNFLRFPGTCSDVASLAALQTCHMDAEWLLVLPSVLERGKGRSCAPRSREGE
jgi:hypothetical protein